MELIDGGATTVVLPLSAAVDSFLSDVADGGLTRLSDADLLAEVRELETTRRRLAAADHSVISELDRRGLAATLAMRTASGLLQGLLRLSPHEAKRRVDTGRACGARSTLTGEVLDPLLPELAAAQAAVSEAQYRTRQGLIETSYGQPLTVQEALAIADEAALVGLVQAANGAVLKLGLTQRIANRAQTLALMARDKGCSFPGCDDPPELCQRHHVVPWWLGGPTDLDNLTLLCRYHHREFARRGWRCLMIDGMPWWIPPPWRDPTRDPSRTTE